MGGGVGGGGVCIRGSAGEAGEGLSEHCNVVNSGPERQGEHLTVLGGDSEVKEGLYL